MGLVVVGVDLAVHDAFNLVCVQIARDHHAQIVGDELDHMMVTAHVWKLLENCRAVRVFNILLDGHQPLFTGLLQDVVQQGQELHISRLGVLATLKQGWHGLQGGLEHFRLVVDDKRPQGTAQNRHELGWQGFDDDGHVAAVDGIGAEDARQSHDVADDYKHDVDFA